MVTKSTSINPDILIAVGANLAGPRCSKCCCSIFPSLAPDTKLGCAQTGSGPLDIPGYNQIILSGGLYLTIIASIPIIISYIYNSYNHGDSCHQLHFTKQLGKSTLRPWTWSSTMFVTGLLPIANGSKWGIMSPFVRTPSWSSMKISCWNSSYFRPNS